MTVAATLPLAFVMVAGPQIISAFFFATSEKWKSDSAYFVLGGAVGLLLIVTAAYLLASGTSGKGAKSSGVEIAIIALLVFAMVHVFLSRKRSEPPKWMGKLETATPRFTFTLGFLLFAFFPSDIVVSITIGAHLADQGDPWWHALPFMLLALFLVALPALAVLVLGERAKTFMPKIRDWMNTNSWIVSEIVLVFFIVIILSG